LLSVFGVRWVYHWDGYSDRRRLDGEVVVGWVGQQIPLVLFSYSQFGRWVFVFHSSQKMA
jgi:hypothetical protein